MKRSVAIIAGLALAGLVAPAPPAEALGIGACTISGTIGFTRSLATPNQGTWSIGPAVIQCRGQFNTRELMVRQGPFAGSGSYTVMPTSASGCLRELGSGTVDYWIPTDEQDVHVREPHTFLLGGAGAFTTPTLRGLFQTVSDGNCLTTPPARALFLAEVSLLRLSTADYTP